MLKKRKKKVRNSFRLFYLISRWYEIKKTFMPACSYIGYLQGDMLCKYHYALITAIYPITPTKQHLVHQFLTSTPRDSLNLANITLQIVL